MEKRRQRTKFNRHPEIKPGKTFASEKEKEHYIVNRYIAKKMLKQFPWRSWMAKVDIPKPEITL